MCWFSISRVDYLKKTNLKFIGGWVGGWVGDTLSIQQINKVIYKISTNDFPTSHGVPCMISLFKYC